MATQPKIHLVKGAKVNFRKGSARAAYYKVLAAHNGKTVESFVKAVNANVPSKPKAGKLKGKQEPLAGWLGWFVRAGYVTIK